jgi:thiol-disulfide isomerase/thioredoxin
MQINQGKKGGNDKLKIFAMLLIGGGLLIFGTASLILLSKNTPSSKTSAIGPAQVDFPAPDLRLQDIDGQSVSLADYQGHVILVNNWATWCPPCREEMPILNGYFRDHRHQNFILVAIDAGEPELLVSEYVARFGLDFPVWIDPSSSALNSFRNNYLPSSYLIDRREQVILAWNGAVTLNSLEEHITPLLKE